MKKVLSTAVLCTLLTLSIFFTGCKNSVSSGGGNSGGGESEHSYIIDPDNPPLTLEAIEDGEITFYNLERITGLTYQINDNDSIKITETSGSKSIPVSAGDVVSLFANGTSNEGSYDSCFRINCSSDCYVYGNVMSLLTDKYNSTTKIEKNIAFSFLFFGNRYLTNHKSKKLVLPATVLTFGCYSYMFNYCTSLTKAPELPATTLADYCYQSMFDECSSLTIAPDLPAINLKEGCYYSMFCNCTSLTIAPSLPATTLTTSCYENMFWGCASLKKVECLATNISNYDCTDYWLCGVSSSGTFIKATGVDWSSKTEIHGIPTGWTVQEK